MPVAKDLVGQVFGRLTVKGFSGRVNHNGNKRWLCQCACGTETTVIGCSLTSGRTTSCGCYAREIHRKRGLDLVGKTYGRLTVIKYINNVGIKRMWLCKCSCGAECAKSTSALRKTAEPSCGCTRRDNQRKTTLCYTEDKKRLHVLTGCALCSGCGLMLELSEFAQNLACVNGLDTTCRWCIRFSARLNKYGLSHSEFWSLFEKQLGQCAVEDCTSPATDIDHDHITGRVRGLLCQPCNMNLPHFITPERLHSMAKYLETASANS